MLRLVNKQRKNKIVNIKPGSVNLEQRIKTEKVYGVGDLDLETVI